MTRSGAVISSDGLFRYHLWRDWSGPDLFEPIRSAIFVMLNPSTADADEDDPTIRRCLGYARRWGCNRLDVINLFALRATRPKDLIRSLKADGLVGDPQNDLMIMRVLFERPGSIVVCAWGEDGSLMGRGDEMRLILALFNVQPMALRINESGQPGHPLYLPSDAELIPYV